MPIGQFKNDIDRSALYSDMFEKMVVSPINQPVLIALAKRAIGLKDTYLKIQNTLNIHWWVVAAIHYRESNFSLASHLHNGDSLTRRTVHEPKGRPVKGQPPFSWYDSAVDALLYDNMENTDQFTIGEILVTLERFNGVGYYKYHSMNSPYLWSYTNYYDRGKYASDGNFNAELKDKQAGAAPLIAAIIEVNNGWV